MAIYRVVGGGQGAGGTLPSLAAAVKVATTGDTVIVAPGVYKEALKLETPGVAWLSEEPWGAIIDGGWAGDSYDHEFSIQVGIGAANIQFSGFAIRNCEGRAFVAGNKARGSVIENLRIDNCGTSAFVLTDAVGVTVRGVVATRLGMAWEAGRRPSVAGSVIMVRAEDCLIEECVVAYGHGEGIDIGRGSRNCVVRGCTIFDNSHLGLYFNRCVECIAEGNFIFLTGETRRNAGDEANWPAGIVFGDEGSENMRTNPHSAGNVARGNVVVNCGTLLHVRNNKQNYDTLLDAGTRIENNTFVGGPLTRVGLALDPNEAGRGPHRATIRGNVIEMSYAPGATAARGVAGPRWEHNAWSRLPPIGVGTASDVTGALGLTDPGAALTNMFPEPGHSADLDAYRPTAGSPLIGAGPDGATLGALEPLPVEPPPVVDPPPPEPPPTPAGPDWDALRVLAVTSATQLSSAQVNVTEAQKHTDAAAVLLNLSMLRLADARQAQTDAASQLAALLAALDEARGA